MRPPKKCEECGCSIRVKPEDYADEFIYRCDNCVAPPPLKLIKKDATGWMWDVFKLNGEYVRYFFKNK